MAQTDSTPRDGSIAAMLHHLWRVSGARAWHLVVPMLLVLVSAACEALSFGLLVPLTRAVGHDSFAGIGGSFAGIDWSRWWPDGRWGLSHDAALAMLLIAGIVAGRVAKLATDYGRTLLVVSRSERYRMAVSDATFTRVLGFGRQYFAEHPIGFIDAELGWADAVVRSLLGVEETVRYALALVVKIAVMYALSPALTLAFAISLPLTGWFVRAVDRRIDRIAHELMDADRRVRERILDLLGSIPLVKVNSQERAAAQGYRETLDEARRLIVRRERTTSLRYPLEEFAVLLVMLGVQGSMLGFDAQFSPGDLAPFAAFLLLVQQALPDAKWISHFRTQLSQDRPRLQALARLYTDRGKYIVPSGPQRFTGLSRGIILRGLTFGYHADRPVLREIEATIAAGAMTAIVGHSGAGKTTLVDLIARLYDCPAGTIRFDDLDARALDISSLHAQMAFVSQDVWLLNRSLRDNLTFGLERTLPDDALHAALADVDLLDLVATLPSGLDSEIGDRGVRLSGGQRQRLALARALLRDPAIMILDEATSALDSVTEQQVAQAIQRRAAGRTLIVIAHRLSTIRAADRILVMEQGRLVESGTWEELLARDGAFARLLVAQQLPGA